MTGPDFRQTWNHLTQLRLEIGLPHPTYPNLLRNTRGVLGGWGWLSPKPNTTIDGFGPGAVGGWPDGVFKFTTGSITAAAAMNFYSESYPVQPGQYVASRVNGSCITAATFTTQVEFLAADNSTVVGASAATAPVAFGVRTTGSVVVPAAAAFARLRIDVQRAATGTRDLFFSDAMLLRAATSADATTGIGTFRDTVDTWVNVIAPTCSIDIDRAELDAGTLTARVLDATIDPAVAATIRPGRQVRVTVANVLSWEPLFTGTILDADVKYDLALAARGDNRHAQITLTAVDNVATLARRRMPLCVAEIPHLRAVLEGSGVPWNVNGSRQQLGDIVPVVSLNENATVLDQVVTTRDSKAGYAWVDRRGVLNVADKATADLVFFGKTNLIPANPSFESGTTGWQVGIPANGSLSQGAPPMTPHGTFVGRYTATGAGGSGSNYLWHTAAAPVVAGTTYTASIGYRVNNVAPHDARILLRFYTSGGAVVAGSDVLVIVPADKISQTEFRRISATGVAPPTAAGARLHAFASPALAAGAIFEVDGAMIVEGSESVAYFEGSVQQSFSERQYSSLDLAFSSKHLVNEVNVKSIEWNPADPTKSIEVPYGPYRDQDSALDWGVARREFTVTGLNLAAIQNLALTVLLRNKTPRIMATSLTLPILTQDHITQRALIDLYNLIAVGYEPKRYTDVLRVTGISHNITERGWVMTLNFAPGSSVAIPQVTPPVK